MARVRVVMVAVEPRLVLQGGGGREGAGGGREQEVPADRVGHQEVSAHGVGRQEGHVGRQEAAVQRVHPGEDPAHCGDAAATAASATARERVVMRQHVARVGGSRRVEGGGDGHRRGWGVTGEGGQSGRVEGRRPRRAAMGTAVWAAPGRRTGRGQRLVPGRVGGWVAQVGGFVRQEVFRDVRPGPEGRVEGSGVEGALGAVGAAGAGGEGPAGR